MEIMFKNMIRPDIEMMSQTSPPLHVRCNDKESVGNCHIEFYTTRGAFFQGIKMFVLTLLAAILSIVLPGLHFVTVPLGVLASPFVGIYFYRRTRNGAVKQINGDFICPECQVQNHVVFRGSPPYSYTCTQCQHGLHVAPLL